MDLSPDQGTPDMHRMLDRQAPISARTKSPWQRWTRAWSVLFYALLIVGLAIALTRPDSSGFVPILLTAAAYAAWYELMGNRRQVWTRGRPWATGYFVVLASVWLALVVLEPAFALAGVGLLAHVCRLERLWRLAAALVFGIGLVIGELTAPGPFGPAVLLTAAFASAVLWVMSGLVNDLSDYAAAQRRLRQDLERTQEELVAAERAAARAAERQRLAREIHDTMAQGFTSVVMLMEAAHASLPADVERAHEHILLAAETSRQNLAEARSIVWALRSSRLGAAALPEALAEVASEFGRASGVLIDFEVVGTPTECGSHVETGLLRVTQESLANVAKHADATRAKVTLSFEDDGVRLDVRDDGTGFDPEQTTTNTRGAGLGLLGIRERIENLGGTQTIESSPGSGSTVAIWVPIEAHGRTMNASVS